MPGGALGVGARTYIDHCRDETWGLTLTRLADGKRVHLPFKCRSWRHKGPCSRWRASRDFARVSEALEGVDHESVAFAVLTFDQRHGPYRTVEGAFAGLVEAWPKLRKRLVREYGKLDYVATVEVHRSGWPHLNVIIVGEMGRACQGDGWKKVRQILRQHAIECGLGKVLSLEAARSRKALAGYVVKLCDELDGLSGEVVKLSQAPVTAPAGFRRLRSSSGFLPSAHKSEGWTGHLYDRRTGLPVRPLSDVQERAVVQADETVHAPDVPSRASLLLASADAALDRTNNLAAPAVGKEETIDGTNLPGLPRNRV